MKGINSCLVVAMVLYEIKVLCVCAYVLLNLQFVGASQEMLECDRAFFVYAHGYQHCHRRTPSLTLSHLRLPRCQ
jgi:hypothetical protein